MIVYNHIMQSGKCPLLQDFPHDPISLNGRVFSKSNVIQYFNTFYDNIWDGLARTQNSDGSYSNPIIGAKNVCCEDVCNWLDLRYVHRGSNRGYKEELWSKWCDSCMRKFLQEFGIDNKYPNLLGAKEEQYDGRLEDRHRNFQRASHFQSSKYREWCARGAKPFWHWSLRSQGGVLLAPKEVERRTWAPFCSKVFLCRIIEAL